MAKKSKQQEAVEQVQQEEESVAREVAQGLASVALDGVPMLTITKSSDGTFGWRSHGKMQVIGRNGESKMEYKFRKGFADATTAIAAGICYMSKHIEFNAADLSVGEYVAPERAGLSPRRLEDSQDFKDALATTKGLKIPSSVKKLLA